MRTAIITYADDKTAENFEKDFLPTLRGPGQYAGIVFVIYYGTDRGFIKRISKKFSVNFLRLDRSKRSTVFNKRYVDLPKVFNVLPKDVSHLMLIDGGDVWFQKPIYELFKITENGYGFVEEDFYTEEDFNKETILLIKDKDFKKTFLKELKDRRFANGGMIVGNRNKIEAIAKEVAVFLKKIGQDFFGLDQAILNYIINKDGTGINLPEEYNYSLISRQNGFSVKNGLFYDKSKKIVTVVHNSGGEHRLFEKGRRDLSSVPAFPQDYPGTFWGVAAFFNPAKYKNKVLNYRRFRESGKKQGLKLLTVECAFGNNPFELTGDDADKLIQIRTDSALWQKERLLNIGLQNLPDDCDKFAWLDADIIFLNNNWVKETSDLLNNYAIVQPFSTYIRLGRGVLNMDKKELEGVPFSRYIDVEGKRFFGIGYKISQLGKRVLTKTIHEYGHAGLAWAARRDIFKEVGLFDRSLLSAVDMLMAHLFYNNKLEKDCDYYVTGSIKKCLYEWSDKIYSKINGSVYFTNCAVLHLWHGAMEKRDNQECKAILDKFKFDPYQDIKKDANGCWTWSSKKPGLHKAFKKYFYIRNETDSFVIKLFLGFSGANKIGCAILHNIYLKVDREIGLAGLLIKKISPAAYEKIKKIKTRRYQK
jgi:hypothetical protein